MKKTLMIFLFTVMASTISAALPDGPKSVQVYTTADSSSLRLTLQTPVVFTPSVQPLETEVCVFVNPSNTFQTFLGIGGALTDASAEVYAKLSPAKQKEFMTAYYDKAKGIGYTLGRTSIHSCDFSSGSFTYVKEGDKELRSFTIDHDRKFRLPFIKSAIAAAGGQLMLYASPWSPPAFMKSNKNMLQGGKLLPEFYPSWALYYTKFIKAYEAEGIPIWGITVQNEPMAKQTWESCIYTAEEERDFLKLHLGPTMAKEGLGAKKIVVWDHNRDLIDHRVNVIFNDADAAKYAWGTGFHWYESWSGGRQMFENIKAVNEAFPEKHLMFTEGCADSYRDDRLQHWPNAERYGESMINDFNNGTVAWTDWNVLLDERGGPNHVSNFCFAPLHADTRTGELIYTPSYFYIGHFSKFIRPGAKRIGTAASRSQLLSTSFRNEDGSMVTVVMNTSNAPVTFRLLVAGQSASVTIPARAIQSLIY